MAKKKNTAEDPNHEVFAAHLLLTSPTNLAKKWAETKEANEGRKAVEAELKNLNLSEPMKEFVRDVTQQFWPARNAFRGVGQAVGSVLYGGSEPHPTGKEMAAIIDALKALKP